MLCCSAVLLLASAAFAPNYDESAVPDYTLPDPLVFEDGSPVESAADWPRRRAEILDLFRAHVYGHRPAQALDAFEAAILEEDPSAMDGAATLRRVELRSALGGRAHAFELVVFTPNGADGPAPALLLLNNRAASNTDPTRAEKSPFWPAEEIVARGYAAAAIQVRDLAPDSGDAFRQGIIALFEDIDAPRPADAWAGLSAWGWGASRVLDFFEDDPLVDASRVAVVGHSRGGKAALWAAAEDERFAMAASNQSGCGGAALSRRRFGERIVRITAPDRYHYWFCAEFAEYSEREDELPIDQHQLLALVAPRPVAVNSAVEDRWADPKGEFLAALHAGPVFELLGAEPLPATEQPAPGEAAVGTIAYRLRPGGHDLRLDDWQFYLDFADKHLRP